MEGIQIGQFIRDVRLEQGMTQQQLADKLGVTDKAVSKWERCVSYPDITILRDLADALGVSVTELLAGKRDAQSSPVPPEVEDVVLDTVSYAETARRKNSGWRFWLFVAVSAGCFIAVLVLCIIDKFRFFGSRIAIQSIAFGWAVCYPLLRVERYPIRRSITVLTLAIIPYLVSVNPRLGNFRYLAIVLLSLAYLWAVYFICVKYRQQKRLVTGWVLALGGLLSMAIALLVSGSFSNFISGIALLSAGIGCLLVCYWERFLGRTRRQ